MTALASSTADEKHRVENEGSSVRRLLSGGVKVIFGVFFCMTPLTAVIVLGWLMRYMRREMVREWCRLNGRDVHSLPEFRRWPNWFVGQGNGRGVIYKFAGSLFENLVLGVKALLPLMLVTLSFGILWSYAWWAGWSNSFNKGYEQSEVGPLTFVVGVGVFIGVMSYLPMALAHQAATGKWRDFFRARTVWMIISRNRIRWLLLSIAWGLAAVPLFFFRATPVFVESFVPGFFEQPEADITRFANSLHFWATVYVFMATIILRRLTSRMYAKSLSVLVREGRLRDASGWGVEMCKRLQKLPAGSQRKVAGGVIRRLTTSFAIILNIIIWSGFAFLILVGQFFNHDWYLWVMHPLIQIPWVPGPVR